MPRRTVRTRRWALAANSASVPPPTAAPSRRGEGRLLAPVGLEHGVAAGRPHSDVLARVAARGWAAIARRQGDRLVEDGARCAHPQGEAELDELRRAPTQSEVSRTCAACCQPMSGGEQDAAGRLGGHAQLGERHAQARPGVDQDEIAVGEEGEAEPDGDAVHRGEERDRQVDEAVEQPHEALPGALDGGAGGDGRHFGQVLARR